MKSFSKAPTCVEFLNATCYYPFYKRVTIDPQKLSSALDYAKKMGENTYSIIPPCKVGMLKAGNKQIKWEVQEVSKYLLKVTLTEFDIWRGKVVIGLKSSFDILNGRNIVSYNSNYGTRAEALECFCAEAYGSLADAPLYFRENVRALREQKVGKHSEHILLCSDFMLLMATFNSQLSTLSTHPKQLSTTSTEWSYPLDGGTVSIRKVQTPHSNTISTHSTHSTTRTRKCHTPTWFVRGHWRRHKNGKILWIEEHCANRNGTGTVPGEAPQAIYYVS